MKTATKAGLRPRPLLELLLLNPPEDNPQRRDFEYEIHQAWEKFRLDHPLGLRRDELNFDLNATDQVYEVLAQKLYDTGKFVAYLDAHYGESDKRSAAWHSTPPDYAVLGEVLRERFHDFRLHWLRRHLTAAQVARGDHDQTSSGQLDTDIYNHPHHIYLHKLGLSAWHWHTPYQGNKISWERIVQFHKFFMAFDFGLEGFDVTIDHSHHWCNRRGSGEYTGWKTDPESGDRLPNTWLDGEFGLIISRGGVHLLTLGVCTTNKGILVNQIQLKQKKGNRWLFQLPKPYFEYALERLLAASEATQLPLFLVTGESHAEELGRVHEEALKNDPTIAPRIIGIYNRPLKGMKRVGSRFPVSTLVYRQIVRRVSQRAAKKLDKSTGRRVRPRCSGNVAA